MTFFILYIGDNMKDENIFLDKVVKKTNVNKNEILKLANDLQSKNLNDENDIKQLQRTLDLLDEDDDVQYVYHNWDE